MKFLRSGSSSARACRMRAVAVAIAVVITGCGGGGSPTASSSRSSDAPIGKAEFVDRANAICQTMNDRIKALPAPGSDLRKVADQYTQAGQIVAETLQQLRSLPQPADDQTTLNANYEKVDALLADYEPFINALRDGDRSAAKSLQTKLIAEQTEANDAFNAYGLTVCGS